MIPTGRQVGLWGVPIALAVGVIAVPALAAPMIAFDLVLVAVLLVDAALSSGRLSVERTVAPVQAVGRAFPVRLRVQNRGARALDVRVVDLPPSGTPIEPIVARVPGRAEVELDYRTRMDGRGHHAFGETAIRWRSPLGLWERQVRVHQPQEIRVYPDFAQLRTWGMDARLSEQRVPVRSRRRSGGENEFQRLRPYVSGDPYRHIDWKATARRREFVSREFGQESNQNVIFLLDAGRMASARYGELTAFDHALDAALTLGQVALRHGDRVGLLAFDDRVRAWLPPKGGARSGPRLIRSTYDLFPSLREPDYALAFRHLATRVRRRSLVVLLTAVVDEVNAELAAQLVRGLGRRHVALTVWLRDPEVDALADAPARGPDDVWRRGAAAEVLLWRERSLSALRQRGGLVVDTPIDALTPSLLSRYLEIKSRRLM